MNLMYLCHFRSLISDFWFCSIPLSNLSNATGLTQFGFFKKELCPISHNALSMDSFSRAHLYDMPRVTVYSSGSEIDREKIIDYALSSNFYGIPMRYSERVMMILPMSLLLDEFQEPAKTLTSTDHISENIGHIDLKFLQELH